MLEVTQDQYGNPINNIRVDVEMLSAGDFCPELHGYARLDIPGN